MEKRDADLFKRRVFQTIRTIRTAHQTKRSKLKIKVPVYLLDSNFISYVFYFDWAT